MRTTRNFYFQTRSSDMKEIQILASKYLFIPATSTDSEKMFSKVGQIVTCRRTKLKRKKEKSSKP